MIAETIAATRPDPRKPPRPANASETSMAPRSVTAAAIQGTAPRAGAGRMEPRIPARARAADIARSRTGAVYWMEMATPTGSRSMAT